MEIILLILGAALGAIPSWLISRHYYKESNLNPPKWAEEHFEKIIEKLPEKLPEDFDLVKIFEEALEDSNVVRVGKMEW